VIRLRFFQPARASVGKILWAAGGAVVCVAALVGKSKSSVADGGGKLVVTADLTGDSKSAVRSIKRAACDEFGGTWSLGPSALALSL
jgi:hypothetical protein